MNRILTLVTILFLLSASTVLSQDFCEGDFDYDGDVDGMDALGFKADFGRRQDGSDPCPLDGPAPVEKTGQTTCYDTDGNPRSCAGTGEDGEHQKGVTWLSTRFTNNGNGTVTDNLTGLMWTKNANLPGGTMNWQEALIYVDAMNHFPGMFGYTDWRIANVKELQSLIDFSRVNPALPSGHPFDYVQSNSYWSATTNDYYTYIAWYVSMSSGSVSYDSKTDNHYVWCVRGGQ